MLRTTAGAALGAAGVTGPGGCGLFGDDPQPPAPDPAQPALDGARALAAAYERTIAARPELTGRLTPMVQAHRAHAAELVRMIGGPADRSSPAAPTASTPSAALGISALRAAEQNEQRTVAALCRTAPADQAALLGTIAAARAAHAEALRGAA